MKKKIIAISAAIAIIAIAVVGGSLAWFTSSAEVTNTFTMGKVSITLDEAKVDKNGKAIIGDGAARVRENSYHIVPGAVLDKDPTVTVVAGSADCWVYVYIENQLEDYAVPNIDPAFWDKVDPEDYHGLYRYKSVVTSPANEEGTKLTVFTQVTIAGGDVLTNSILDDLADADTSPQINVKAFAIQSANITGVAEADGIAWNTLTGTGG